MDSRIASARGRSRLRATWRVVAVGGSLLLPASGASASHSVFVTVPPRSEEALTWCGAATGQMVVAGYPASACVKDQADVDASIQAHKVEGNWDADPAGLRDAMMEQCPPPGGGHWVAFARPDAPSLMYSAAYWMTRNHYPVAMLMGTAAHNGFAPHQEHWVAIKGLVTNVDPTTAASATVNLEYVFFVDPAVPLGDPPMERFVAASTWYAELQAVTKAPSAYTGKFVAVIEPPTKTGRAIARAQVLVGRVIPLAQAVRRASEAVRTLKLAEKEEFRGLAQARPLDPLLVNPRRGGYYIVPFAEGDKPPALAVLVNAYTGEFQEAGRFAARKFLPEKAALEHVRKALRLEQLPPGDYKVELASPEAGARYLPEWRVTLRGRTLAVDQAGAVRGLRPKPR